MLGLRNPFGVLQDMQEQVAAMAFAWPESKISMHASDRSPHSSQCTVGFRSKISTSAQIF